jgi:DNA (cytosine-5)-methyltransferase 1
LKFLDLFSGIGGFRLGMEMAGHCEIDKYADKSYRAMHNVKEDEWYGSDIRAVRTDELPRADCWCFGFPCQDISVAGKQTGFKGNRSSLFFAVTRLINDLKEEDRPKYLFIENVKNLFSVNGGFDFAKLLIELDSLGYDAEWQLLNSKDFGVPQNRERVFIIGHLRGASTRKVFPIASYNSKIAKGFQGDVSGKGYASQQDRVYEIDGIMNCLPASQTKSKTKIIVKDNNGTTKIRGLTPKECFRLQGFPDEYFERVEQVNSDSRLYKQSGNGVTVNVIYEIAKRL